MPSFLWNHQHRLLKRGLNSFPLEFLLKALRNLQWSFIRWLLDIGDKLLGTSVFGFSLCKTKKNFDSEGNTYSLSRKISAFLKTAQMEGEILYQWHVDLTEHKLNEQYVGRETACSPGHRHSFCQVWRWFLVTMAAFRRVIWYRDVLSHGSNHGLAMESCHTKFYADLSAKT